MRIVTLFLLVLSWCNALTMGSSSEEYFIKYPDEKNETIATEQMRMRERALSSEISPDTLKGDEKNELKTILNSTLVPHNTTKQELDNFLLSRLAPFKVPENPGQWEAEKNQLRELIMREVVEKGHDPKIFKEKPAVHWQETIETKYGYRIRKLCYEMWPGFWGPALIYEPLNLNGKVPVVLNTMGHGGRLDNDFRQIRAINQVKRGMIAMCIEWIGSGGQLSTTREAEGYLHEAWIECFEICGRSGLAPFHTTLTRALDILLELPNADSQKVAVTGYSSGGTQALFLGALDPRITVCIPVAGHAGDRALIEHYSYGCPTMFPSKLWSIAGFSLLNAMLAPKPALVIYNKYDDCCWQSDWAIPSLYDPISSLYKVYDKSENFAVYAGLDRNPGHNYGKMNREAMYRFLNKHFFQGQSIDEEIPYQDELLTGEQLKVELPDNMTIHEYFERYAACLPKKPLENAVKGDLSKWYDEKRQALAENIKVLAYKTAQEVVSKEISATDYSVRGIVLKVGNDWSIPVVDISAKDYVPERIAIVLADGSRDEGASVIKDLIADGHRCLAVDLFFIGECYPVTFSFPNAEYAIQSFGEHSLGIKIGQLYAILGYVRDKYPQHAITLVGTGLNSSVTSLVATAMAKEKPDLLVTDGLPVSLRVLVERSFFRAYSLFNFGLLKEADTKEMLALCLPANIQLVNIQSSYYHWKYPDKRIENELRTFCLLANSQGKMIDLSQTKYKPIIEKQTKTGRLPSSCFRSDEVLHACSEGYPIRPKAILPGGLVGWSSSWETERRAQFVRDNQLLLNVNARLDYVFIGDSLTHFWDLNRYFDRTDMVLINRGLAGDIPANILSRFEADVIQLHPKYVHIWTGVNDLFNAEMNEMGFDESTGAAEAVPMTAKNIQHLAERAKKAGIIPILGSVTPITSVEYMKIPNRKIDAKTEMAINNAIPLLNIRIRQIAEQTGGIYVDYYSAVLDESGFRLCQDLTDDGIHFNDAGCHKLTKILRSTLSKYGAKI